MPSTRSMLVVEDDPLVAAMLERVFRRFAEAVVARSCNEAAKALDTRAEWHAIIVDVGLPDGSGLDVLAAARTRFQDVPALVLTGEPDAHAANRAFDLNAHFLRKPASIARLTRFLHAHRTPLGALERRVDALVDEWAARYGLSEAEADVLLRAVRGESRMEIAEARSTSPETLKKQIASLLSKTQNATLLDAVARALRELASR